MAGPRVRATGEIDAHIADVTATLLARLDVSVPASFAGRVLWEALVDNFEEPRTLPEVTVEKANGSGNRFRVEERLRALGVDRALARAGARGGDEVRIGAMSFDYEPDEIGVAHGAGRK